MPFIRYSRDKRGYESTLVMHAYRPSQGPQRTRVLYLFRSLAHLKIGRKALDAEVVEALEHTHPDLSFDWTALLREPTREAAREDARARAERGGGRQGSRQTGRQGTRRPPPNPIPAPPPRPVLDDQTLLGLALGAGEAARLRNGYAQLLQWIARRSRTPEERDRLTERAVRLNPDEWSDEAAATAQAPAIESQWEAVLAELPTRRRGRRGGRRRDPAEGPAAAEASGIMAAGGVEDAKANDQELDRSDRAADGGGDDGGALGAADEPADPVSDDR